MRLANGIVIDKEKTFGVLKFSALRREVHVQNEDGTVSISIVKKITKGKLLAINLARVHRGLATS